MEKLKDHPTLGYNYQQMGDKINELVVAYNQDHEKQNKLDQAVRCLAEIAGAEWERPKEIQQLINQILS